MAYEPFLPDGMKWWQLFDLVIVSACKPDFFSEARRPSYEIATPDGMPHPLTPTLTLTLTLTQSPTLTLTLNPHPHTHQACCAR